MKQFCLEEEERRTLFEMGMWHPHPRVRRHAQALVRLAQGVTQTQVAKEFGVHLNSVRIWMNRWRSTGVLSQLIEKNKLLLFPPIDLPAFHLRQLPLQLLLNLLYARQFPSLGTAPLHVVTDLLLRRLRHDSLAVKR